MSMKNSKYSNPPDETTLKDITNGMYIEITSRRTKLTESIKVRKLDSG